MTTYKYQEDFARELAESWTNGNREHVRTTIRGLKNKAQAAYIAAVIASDLSPDNAEVFCRFIHPDNR